MKYQSQIILKQIGVSGQQMLRQSKVLVVGAGGLGCPVLLYLAAAGVGCLGILDFDKVEEKNLNRQVLYTPEMLGKSKAEYARAVLKRQNPDVEFKVYNEKISAQNAVGLIRDFDIVIDCTDNFPARYAINDACVQLNKPFVYGALHGFEMQVSVFNLIGADGSTGPNYRDFIPEQQNIQTHDCSTIGIIGATAGICGSLQAMEVIKIITGAGEPLSGKILNYNLLSHTFNVYKISSGKQKPKTFETQNMNYKLISVQELEKLPQESTLLIDVRELHEVEEEPEIQWGNYQHLSYDEALGAEGFGEEYQHLVFACANGNRSRVVAEMISSKMEGLNIYSLKESIMNCNKNG